MKRQRILGPIGVVDVGAHSLRLEIVQFKKTGEIEVLEELSQPVALGRDVFSKGAVRPENINLSGKILRDFASKMDEYGVKYRKAVATSAVREATNRDLFLASVRHTSGIEVEVLESPEEIRLLYLAIKKELRGAHSLKKKNALICIIGTGSTHIITVRNGLLQSAEALRIGTLRIYEEIGQSFSLKRSFDIVDTFTSRVVQFVKKHHFSGRNPNLFIAAGAPVRLLSTIVEGKASDNGVSILSRSALGAFAKTIHSAPPEFLAEKYGITDFDAQGLGPCAEILEHFFETTNVEHVVVPSVNTRDAIVDEIIRKVSSVEDPFLPDLISSAEFLAKKYRSNMEHSQNVAQNAVRLFDQTRDLHGIGERGRTLLYLAAILHDIGQFVNNRQHHKHACYLIHNSPLPGVNPREQAIIAATARYHRRGLPKTSHPEYNQLQPQDRVLVSYLAAILRVADSLDHSNTRRISNFEVEYDDSEVRIITKDVYDLTIEQLELKRRGDLFFEIFGRKAVLK